MRNIKGGLFSLYTHFPVLKDKVSSPQKKGKRKKEGLSFFLAILKLRSYWFKEIIDF